jgi:DNA topoisomerase-1
MKPFCVNESCKNFLPEDKRGYYKKKAEDEGTEKKPAKKSAATKTKKTEGKK